jgi:uncharacterized cofD-like protein
MKSHSAHSTTDPRIVVIGGGTGLSTMLRGLKLYSKNLTAIVTVADDGGGSGQLRDDLGMPPPGDIRNCLQALANTEPTMEQLLGYRFTEGRLAGQSFGNLFLAALNEMSSSFDEAVLKMSEVLAITGRVLPVSNEDLHIAAEFDDGTEIFGESNIARHKVSGIGHINHVRLIPEGAMALPSSLEAIEKAELLILGPGSLFTSIIPNLLVGGVSEAIVASKAMKVYVLNIMTQDGETERLTASDHVRALFRHAGDRKLFDYCLANSAALPPEVLARYKKLGSEPTVVDAAELESLGVTVVTADIADITADKARHDPLALAEELMLLYRNKSHTRIYE